MVIVTAPWSSGLHINNVTMFVFMLVLALVFMMVVMRMMVIVPMSMLMLRVSHRFCTQHT
ncbi:hypothetical protein U9608_000221 [Vibrio alginolyticus]|nr:hypothetical protein BAU10_21270 [Vibrio alginolyticus]EAS75512.1 hypothetical protein V12G01_06416 [Vibrio alginolyticus 12G01]KFJ86659.1 hypothetical protein IJ23_16760 [Vibrio sp. OY15]MDK9730503.1 hypothetical protein [Vibrio sp. D415a]MDK9731429.1 hypothetical protein [Vibrio sp. B511a]MDK9747948.1 hypothetical protein [Vibrio sp. D409a]MDK9766764.1 hypothetical protein [Vibrio sp. D417a]MDK9787078.1 hypothetical protein [Vibrio sp. D421a]NAW95109.1 hypothetical protein [Vibrio sp. 